jgi:hypothetical protein
MLRCQTFLKAVNDGFQEKDKLAAGLAAMKAELDAVVQKLRATSVNINNAHWQKSLLDRIEKLKQLIADAEVRYIHSRTSTPSGCVLHTTAKSLRRAVTRSTAVMPQVCCIYTIAVCCPGEVCCHGGEHES